MMSFALVVVRLAVENELVAAEETEPSVVGAAVLSGFLAWPGESCAAILEIRSNAEQRQNLSGQLRGSILGLVGVATVQEQIGVAVAIRRQARPHGRGHQ